MLRISRTTETGLVVIKTAASIAHGDETSDRWREAAFTMLQPQWRHPMPHQRGLSILEINDPEHPATLVAAGFVNLKHDYYWSDHQKSDHYQATLNFRIHEYQHRYRLLANATINVEEWFIKKTSSSDKGINISRRAAKHAMGYAADLLIDTVITAATQEREKNSSRTLQKTSNKQRAATNLNVQHEARQQVDNAMPQVNQVLHNSRHHSPWKDTPTQEK